MLYFLIKNIIPYLSYNVINETNKKFFLGGENFVYNLQGFIEKYVIFSNKYYKF
jgi:GTP cyclohydrolase III